jgi:Acyltransferase
MNRLPLARTVPHWGSKLSPLCVRLGRSFRRRRLRRDQRVSGVEVRGAERLRALVGRGAGVLLAPNHAGHPDPFVLCEAAEAVGRPFLFMTAWQVFATQTRLARRVMRWHGCFSVDREGTDLRAFKEAVGILSKGANPLVIFPEGEVYHTNDRVTPFRDGPAAIALAARKQAERPVYVVPCAIKYRYVADPTPELDGVLAELEQRLFWRPQPKRSLADRVLRFAEGALALKEIEHLGATQTGRLPERIAGLIGHILGGLERAYGLKARGDSVPERIKAVRRACLDRLGQIQGQAEQQAEVHQHLDDVFLVVQLFSYPGDYVAERPTIERLAETVDKFEEDVLGYPMARPRGQRSAVFQAGEPIDVGRFADGSTQPRRAARPLTDAMERSVQGLLDEINRG